MALNRLDLVLDEVLDDLDTYRVLLIDVVLCGYVISVFNDDWTFITFSKHDIVLFHCVDVGYVDWMWVPLVLVTA